MKARLVALLSALPVVPPGAVKLLNAANVFTTSRGRFGKTNIYWSPAVARYELENLTGGAVSYAIFFQRKVF